MNIDVMSAGYIQAERVLRIETPLGPDVLLPQRMEMREEVSGLFELTVSVHSKRLDLSARELAGEYVDVSLDIAGGKRRTWNGLVTELTEGPMVTRTLRAYRLVLRPAHWLLSQRSDCRIWLDKTSVEVAQILMGEHKLASPVTGGVVVTPPAQHYSVQFNETDLAYLTRRLEEDGIFYWFAHEGGSAGSVSARHILHLASDTSGYMTGDDPDVRFAMGSSDRNHISKLEKTFRYLPGKRAGADWNFETPSLVPGGGTPSLVKLPGNEAYELYEYPSLAGYGTGQNASEGIDNAAVERQSKLRMMSSEAGHERIEGKSMVRSLAPGQRFKPYDVANPSNVFEEYVITHIVHMARDNSYETNEGAVEYENTFTALPSRVPDTPHRLTPHPKIDGTQIALIAGPEGEEIHPDKYGRVKVWFPWDRRAKRDGSDTCWIRVAQNWAGTGFGGQIIPRIGMEVMVMYLDGDPDRPVITGVVPNSRRKVPYKLPENKTKSVFRTNTHKGTGFNELSFEDENGREEIFMRAQKDLTVKVDNHATKRVDANQVVSIGGMSLREIEKSSTENVAQNLSINVGTGALGNIVSGQARQDTFGMRPAAYFLDQSLNEAAGSGNFNLDAANSIRMNTAAAFSVEVKGVMFTTVGQNHTANVGGSFFTSAGADHREVVGAKKMIDAHGEIHLRCGKSELVMKPDGVITIKGLKLVVAEEEHIDLRAARIDLNK